MNRKSHYKSVEDYRMRGVTTGEKASRSLLGALERALRYQSVTGNLPAEGVH